MPVMTAYWECSNEKCTFGLRAISDGEETICPICLREGRGEHQMHPAPGTEIKHQG